MLGRVGEVVLAAQHERDAHVHVIDDDRHVVGRRAVRAQQHEVVEHLVVELDLAAHEVGEAHRRVGHAEGTAAGSPAAWRAAASAGGMSAQVRG